MAEQVNGDKETLKPEEGPTCPKCGEPLTNYLGHIMTIPAGVVHMTWCGNKECRCLLAFQLIGPAPQPQKSGPRIIPGSGLPFNPTRKM